MMDSEGNPIAAPYPMMPFAGALQPPVTLLVSMWHAPGAPAAAAGPVVSLAAKRLAYLLRVLFPPLHHFPSAWMP